jgi:hypothetical protein
MAATTGFEFMNLNHMTKATITEENETNKWCYRKVDVKKLESCQKQVYDLTFIGIDHATNFVKLLSSIVSIIYGKPNCEGLIFRHAEKIVHLQKRHNTAFTGLWYRLNELRIQGFLEDGDLWLRCIDMWYSLT